MYSIGGILKLNPVPLLFLGSIEELVLLVEPVEVEIAGEMHYAGFMSVYDKMKIQQLNNILTYQNRLL